MARTVAAVLFIWAGLLLGVAFVATPAKFLAPSLALAQALDVGRWTFYVLAVIEWCIAIGVIALLLLPFARTGSSRALLYVFACLWPWRRRLLVSVRFLMPAC